VLVVIAAAVSWDRVSVEGVRRVREEARRPSSEAKTAGHRRGATRRGDNIASARRTMLISGEERRIKKN